jgi:hypothetical protein
MNRPRLCPRPSKGSKQRRRKGVKKTKRSEKGAGSRGSALAIQKNQKKRFSVPGDRLASLHSRVLREGSSLMPRACPLRLQPRNAVVPKRSEARLTKPLPERNAVNQHPHPLPVGSGPAATHRAVVLAAKACPGSISHRLHGLSLLQAEAPEHSPEQPP